MGLLSLFRRVHTAPESKSQPGTGWGWFGSSGSVPGGVSSPQPISRDPLNLLSLNVGIVAACSNRNAQSVASAQPRLYAARKKNQKFITGIEARSLTRKEQSRVQCKQTSLSEETVEIVAHPVLDILTQCTADKDGHQLLELTEGYVGLLGYAIWHVEKTGDRVDALHILPSEYTNALVDNEGLVQGWQVKQGTYHHEYKPEEVVVFRSAIPGAATRSNPPMPPTVGIYGCGWLEQCLPEATLLRDINEYERRTMRNNGRPDFAINFKGGSLQPEQRRSLLKMFRAMWSGEHQNEPFIGDGDWDLKPYSWAPKDLSYAEGKKDARLVVCNCAGVPIDLVDSRDSNRATSLTAFRSYAILTVEPKLRRYEDVLNAQLMPHFDDGIFLKFDSPVPLDEEQELKEEQFEVQMGIISVNEARAKRGLDELPEDMRGSPVKAAPEAGGNEQGADKAAKEEATA